MSRGNGRKPEETREKQTNRTNEESGLIGVDTPIDANDKPEIEMLKVDLHSHTYHSPDSALSPAALVERARKAGLDRIAVTDHDAIDGALEAKDLAPETVIVGQEVSCGRGLELIGLFLEEWIPADLPVQEAADRIRAQGGVVYAPHPFAYLIDREQRGRAVIEHADLVEAVNARAFWPAWNRIADDVARERELPRAAGSDAHFAREVGRAFTRMPSFRTAEEFRAALPGAEPMLRRTTSPANHVRSAALRALRYAVPGMKGAKGPRPWSGRTGREVGEGPPGERAPEPAGGAATAATAKRSSAARAADARKWVPPTGDSREGADAAGARRQKRKVS